MTTLPKELILPPRTLVRAGAVAELLPECAAFGSRGLLVHGRSLQRHGALGRILERKPEGVTVTARRHDGGEPTLKQLGALIEEARRADVQWIAAVGGGSVLDLAKAAAGLLEAPRAPAAYHDGETIPPSRVPFLAAPTTAGTGSESTIVSVLTNPDTNVKKSIRHPSFIARLVILDPELLTNAPASVIASAGMDALTQAVESYVSRGATAFTDELALRAVGLVAASLPAVFRSGGPDDRLDLMVGSYLAGLALSNARLGLVHGLAHPLGSRYHQPHGLVCAVCLPPVLAFNAEAMGDKYRRMSDAVGADLAETARGFIRTFGIASPFAGQPILDREGIVRETLASGSTAANPRPVTAPDVEALLEEIFHDYRQSTQGGDGQDARPTTEGAPPGTCVKQGGRT